MAYLCNRRTEEILRSSEHVDEVFVYEKDELLDLWRRSKVLALRRMLALLRQIRRARFDMAIDLSLGERYSFFLALLGVPRRIGFDFRGRGRFLTHRLVMNGFQHRHVVEHYAQLLETLGIRLRDRHLELTPTRTDQEEADRRLGSLGIQLGQRVIGLVPAGGVSWGLQAHFRRWSKDGFIRVGHDLAQRWSAAIVIFGEPKDVDICREIALAIGPAARDLSGGTSLREFVSLIGRCDVVISNDGGPIHIAASQGIRTVSIFGPVDPEVYGPYPGVGHQVVYRADLPCRPCYHQFKLPPCPYERACLTQIQPQDILEACEAALAQSTHESSGIAASAN